jgi:hypothetical protein
MSTHAIGHSIEVMLVIQTDRVLISFAFAPNISGTRTENSHE